MRKWLKRLALGVIGILGVAVAVDVLTYSPRAWLADYARVKKDMAQGYANLDWVVEKRRLDLVELDRKTTAALQSSYSHVRAFLALQDFIGAFRDPHLTLAPGRPPASRSEGRVSQVEDDPPAGADCGAAGYSDDTGDFHPALAKLPGWRPLAPGSFPAATAGPTGFIRIGSFGENNYAAACRRAFRAGMGQRALQLATREVLQAELRGRIDALRKAGTTRMVVDLTGNGGGSEWATEAAALFSPRLLKRRSPLLVGPTCDRSSVWKGERPPCSVFAPAEQEVEELQGTGSWTGPLFILADGATASAAEEFLVWLHDSKTAVLLGQRTLGAGCGYVNGGNPSYLTVVPLAVRMPNCARFLLDGTNEIEGSRPDVAIDLSDGRTTEAIAAALAR